MAHNNNNNPPPGRSKVTCTKFFGDTWLKTQSPLFTRVLGDHSCINNTAHYPTQICTRKYHPNCNMGEEERANRTEPKRALGHKQCYNQAQRFFPKDSVLLGSTALNIVFRATSWSRAKSRDHELVRAQKKVRVQRPSQCTSKIM